MPPVRNAPGRRRRGSRYCADVAAPRLLGLVHDVAVPPTAVGRLESSLERARARAAPRSEPSRTGSSPPSPPAPAPSTPMTTVPDILLFCADLIFQTKVSSTARSLDVSVAVVRSTDRLEERLERVDTRQDDRIATLVIVDLDAEGSIDAIEAVRVRSPGARLIAFVSHVRGDLVAAARTAGADGVLARSAFAAGLPEIVRGARDER